MYAASMRLELLMRGVGSLKEKRRLVSSLITHLDSKMYVGVAEVDHQDKWQRAAVGVAAVAPQAGQLDRVLVAVRKAVESHPGVEVLDYSIWHMENEQ
jgi:uncharacterized protein YlxP (DUF503 family)